MAEDQFEWLDKEAIAYIKKNIFPEYLGKLRKIMDDANVCWQNSELGKVDQGGGGTIAYILGNYNMNVIDAGIAVQNMHACYETASKVDIYEAYLAYKAFIEQI